MGQRSALCPVDECRCDWHSPAIASRFFSSDSPQSPSSFVHTHTSTMSMAGRLRYFINSPTGPKTTHFWGPVANWGFVLAAMADMRKPADVISINMTSALSIYSLIFMRFAWMVKPRNYLLLACHASNEAAQLYQLQRGVRFQASKKAEEKKA